jgi:hypothetical protein
MKLFNMSVYLWVDDEFAQRRPDVDMMKNLLKNKIPVGEINEKLFRGKVVANIQSVEVFANCGAIDVLNKVQSL